MYNFTYELIAQLSSSVEFYGNYYNSGSDTTFV
jgi:hypothetical protein